MCKILLVLLAAFLVILFALMVVAMLFGPKDYYSG